MTGEQDLQALNENRSELKSMKNMVFQMKVKKQH
jgi:hypothetical protein